MDQEILKKIAEAVTAVASLLGLVCTAVLVLLRNKDKKNADPVLEEMRQNLRTLTAGYSENISHEQADKVIESVFCNVEATITCWLCKYINAGHPTMTAGRWNIDIVMNAQYLWAKNKLDVFKYNGVSIGSFVEQANFDKLCDELKQAAVTFNATEGVSRYVSDKIDGIKTEVEDKLV